MPVTRLVAAAVGKPAVQYPDTQKKERMNSHTTRRPSIRSRGLSAHQRGLMTHATILATALCVLGPAVFMAGPTQVTVAATRVPQSPAVARASATKPVNVLGTWILGAQTCTDYARRLDTMNILSENMSTGTISGTEFGGEYPITGKVKGNAITFEATGTPIGAIDYKATVITVSEGGITSTEITGTLVDSIDGGWAVVHVCSSNQQCFAGFGATL